MIRQSWKYAIASVIELGAIAVFAQGIKAATPDPLQVPKGQTFLSKVTTADGVQIYVCKPKADDPNQFEWVLKAPEAKLLQDGKPFGTHYGGPSWEARDGSKIVGQVKARVDAPDANAIPWVLLEVKKHEGKGSLSNVNWIQRVNTTGGKAPTEGCDRANENATTRVAYTSDYLFYGTPASSTSNTENRGYEY